ncbi:AraC family transcriptional regulator [Kitasatospora xanthocidica]|uniref:helix-turn-helix domain-containing protein n=1 Tax=Kitasatospora xanthocidica TaxID=83382 RepID=UPI0019B59D9C|nr:helix-turn-helix domain-containing protein [Kitasatospora xanthocidica]GHF86418.1 AraC family transcriptional regulator [Kitasatospora xanthocidica]
MAGFRARGADPVELGVVPYPAVTVVVDLGGDTLAVDDAGGVRHGGAVVVGLAPGAVRGGGRDVEVLQVRLSPPVAHAVFGDPAHLAAAVVPLEELWGREAARTRERLRACGCRQERFAIAAAVLGRRLEAGRPVDPEVAYAWRRLVRGRGAVRIEELAAQTGWSRKRLWSRFHAQIGLGPKHAARLVRFDHAVHRLAAGHSATRVAAESGYSDQSHLHRDVMAFAGVTPTAVALAPWLAVDSVAWNAPGPGRTPHT